MIQSIPGPEREPGPRLPLELCEQMISYLRDDKRSLTSCSLTCRGFVVCTQKRLYETVPIRDSSRLERLVATLEESPYLVRHIRRIEMQFYPQKLTDRPGPDPGSTLSRLHQILLSHGRVTHLLLTRIQDTHFVGHEDVVEHIQALVRLPTLYHLDLHSCSEFSVQDFLIGSSIKSLRMAQVFPSDLGHYINAQPASHAYDPKRHAPIYLESLIMHDNVLNMTYLSQMMSSRFSPWMKLDWLRRLRMSIKTSDRMEKLNTLFNKVCNTLTELHFLAVLSNTLEWEHDHRIVINSLIYLKRLVLSCFLVPDNKVVPWLLSFLQQCSMLKTLKVLTINFRVYTRVPESLLEDFAKNPEWKTLDGCLSSGELGHIRIVQITMFQDDLQKERWRRPPSLEAESEGFNELCGALEECLSATKSTGRFTHVEVTSRSSIGDSLSSDGLCLEDPFEYSYYWPGRLNDDKPLPPFNSYLAPGTDH